MAARLNRMNFKFLLPFVILLFVSGFSRATDWQDFKPGLSYKKLSVQLGDKAADLHVFRVNPAKFSIKPVFNGSSNRTAKQMLDKTGALAVINANFFDTNGRVLGYVRQDKKLLHPKKNVSWWSILCIKKNRARIIHTAEHREGMCDQAVQAGPRLLVNGKTPPLKNETSRKTAVAVNKRGEVFLVVSRQAVPVQKLAAYLAAPEGEGGLDCLHALNLDGGSSSQVYAKIGEFELDVANYIKVPVGLGVFAP